MSSNTTKLEFHSPGSLETVAGVLPEAMEVPLFREDPEAEETDFMSELDGHKGVANPETGDLYGVVTGDYEVINPEEFLVPLAEGLRERERHDVSGFFNVHDDGASGYGELLFDTDAIYPPDRTRSDEPVRVGTTVRYSHDGGVSVRASGFAQDGMCVNTMRRVTDSVYVKHAGDVDARVDWDAEWGAVLDQLGVFSETLATVIEQAMDFVVFDFTTDEDPFSDEWVDATNPQNAIEDIAEPVGVTSEEVRGIHGFYEYLGMPRYIALSATDRLTFRMMRSEETRTASAWDTYSALTYALSHQNRFQAGSSSDDDYHRIASDLLANPVKAIEDAERGYQEATAPDREAESASLFGIDSTVGEALAAYKEREEQMRSSFGAE